MENHPLGPLDDLAVQLRRVPGETIPVSAAHGRVLLNTVLADRDSPAADVSAMDGYGMRVEDAIPGRLLQVIGESVPGQELTSHPQPGQALRILTGAIVPPECALVIRREDIDESTTETSRTIRIGECSVHAGLNIRRRGENTSAGDTVLQPGTRLHAGHVAAAANFGVANVEVARRIHVAILVTGNEIVPIGAEVQPWQLRDSNGPTLAALLSNQATECSLQQVGDSLSKLTSSIRDALNWADAVILTGGVSMGDYDFVPQACQAAGATTLFHKLPIRPGKPIFGAVGAEGQLVVGLPGNPVSAAVGAARFVRPLLARMEGDGAEQSQSLCVGPRHQVHLLGEATKTLSLFWFRLVRWTGPNQVELAPSRGSGDLVSLAQSDGFIELPPGASGPGPWPFTPWAQT